MFRIFFILTALILSSCNESGEKQDITGRWLGIVTRHGVDQETTLMAHKGVLYAYAPMTGMIYRGEYYEGDGYCYSNLFEKDYRDKASQKTLLSTSFNCNDKSLKGAFNATVGQGYYTDLGRFQFEFDETTNRENSLNTIQGVWYSGNRTFEILDSGVITGVSINEPECAFEGTLADVDDRNLYEIAIHSNSCGEYGEGLLVGFCMTQDYSEPDIVLWCFVESTEYVGMMLMVR